MRGQGRTRQVKDFDKINGKILKELERIEGFEGRGGWVPR